MRRRNFIALLGSLMVMGSLTVHAQSGGMRRIGVLMSYPETDPDAQAFLAAFREGLQKLGWTEGRNIRLDTRWTSASAGNVEEMQRFAKELVALQPDLLLGHTTSDRVTETNPHHSHHFCVRFRPGRERLSDELPKSGWQRHRFHGYEPTMAGKWLELLKEIAPRVARVALLFNPATAAYAEYYLKPFKAAAPLLIAIRMHRAMSEFEVQSGKHILVLSSSQFGTNAKCSLRRAMSVSEGKAENMCSH